MMDSEEHSVQLFDTLPDEVLRLILNKVTDPKSLLRCSLISNRFSSLLSNSHSLSLHIPTPIPLPTPIPPHHHRHLNSSTTTTTANTNNFSTRFLTLLALPFRFVHHIVSPKPPHPPSDLDSDDALLILLTKLLRRFPAVRSLRIQLPCSCHNNIKFRSRSSVHDDERSSVFKWKAKFGLQIKTFSFLLPTSVRRITTDQTIGIEDEEQDLEPQTFDWLNRGYGKAFRPMYYAFSMHRVLLLLIAQNPNLESVEITDSKKQGKLSLEGEEIVELRNAMNLSSKRLESVDLIVLPQHFKLWYVPELKLSLSGFVMERVTLVVFKRVCAEKNYEVDDEDDNGDVLEGGFEDDKDGIYDEAMKEILTNHQDKLKLSL